MKHKTDVTEASDSLTYDIRGTEGAKAITLTVRCNLCRQPLSRGSGGWCESCQEYPISIRAMRFCERNHPVNPDGYCAGCDDFVLTELVPGIGKWTDTRLVQKKLTKADLTALVRSVTSSLAGKGWPEQQVPLNRRYIPRSWKRRDLVLSGQTPNGDDIVYPSEK